MAPPQLARDAPVLDVAHPFEVGLRPVLRHEANTTILDGRNRRRGERLDAHEPLIGQIGFDHGLRTIAARDHQLVLVDAGDEACRVEFGDDALAGFEPIETPKALRNLVIQGRIGREHVDHRQIVALTDGIIVEIVGWRDLDATRPEFGVDIVVGNHRDLTVGERQQHGLADDAAIALIGRVYGHRRVAEHRFRTRRRDDYMPAAVGQWIA